MRKKRENEKALTVLKYLEQKIREGIYYNYSHAVESIIKEKMKEDKAKQ